MLNLVSRTMPSPSMAVSLLALVIALGGAGIAATGGNFLLGKNNRATTPSLLIGDVVLEALQVRNLNAAAGATALRLETAANRPPLEVTSAVKVAKLNADYLDGLSANQFGRVAYKEQRNSSWSENGRTTIESVTLAAPRNGFVMLAGGASAAYSSGCGYCAVHIRFRIDSATDTSTAGTIINQSSVEQYAPLSHTVTVPVRKGTHTYDLVGSWYDVNATNIAPEAWYDSALSAHFIPFNGIGTTALPLATRTTEKAPGMSSRVQVRR